MRKIVKRLLSFDDRSDMELPKNWNPRHVGLDQAGRPSIWIEFETLDEMCIETFVIVKDEEEIKPNLEYIGTIIRTWDTGHVYCIC